MPHINDGLVFEPQLDGYGFEEGAIISTRENGGIHISVAQECAVDSYNSSFTCGITMTREQTTELRDWLTAYLATPQEPLP